MDKFFTQQHCDRCHKPLTNGRIMSMFNEQCICMECKELEKQDSEYQKAVETDRAEIKKGNYNQKGLRAK